MHLPEAVKKDSTFSTLSLEEIILSGKMLMYVLLNLVTNAAAVTAKVNNTQIKATS